MLSWNQITLFIAPWLLLATTYLVYQLLERRYGKKKSYLGGFLFYWIVWCVLFPLALLGPRALVRLFHSVPAPFGHPWWLGDFCVLALAWWPSSLFSHRKSRPGTESAYPSWCFREEG